MTPAELQTRALNVSGHDINLLKSVIDANHESARSIERIRWQYLENPVGRLFIDASLDTVSSVVAGVYAVFPVRMKVGQVLVTGAQSLDTLTDARYRGRGLFVSLATSLYARLATTDVGLVYGFPNDSSAHGFFNKLNWNRLDPLPMLVRPLRSRYFAARVPGIGAALSQLPDMAWPISKPAPTPSGSHLEEITRFDDRFDSLWAMVAPQYPVAVVRDSRYLNWRFVARPGSQYSTVALVTSEGRVLGFVTFCVLEKHGGRIGYLMELMIDPAASHAARVLLGVALDTMKKRGADAVLAWNLPHSPTAAAHRRAGFLPLPERIRPIHLHFGARSFRPEFETLLASRTNWYVSYADSDTV